MLDLVEQYKFCPKCAGALIKRDDNLLLCSKCGHQNYINPIPGVIVVIQNKNQQVLLVKREFEPQKGLWDLPGGFLDLGETFEEAAIREIQEELGLRIKQQDLVYLESDHDRYLFSGINHYTTGIIFGLKPSSNLDIEDLKVADDISRAKFFSYNVIPWDKIAFPVVTRFLKKQIISR